MCDRSDAPDRTPAGPLFSRRHKGWLTKSDVMNCLPLEKIEAALQRSEIGRLASRAAA
jgi:hypothetical protein